MFWYFSPFFLCLFSNTRACVLSLLPSNGKNTKCRTTIPIAFKLKHFKSFLIKNPNKSLKASIKFCRLLGSCCVTRQNWQHNIGFVGHAVLLPVKSLPGRINLTLGRPICRGAGVCICVWHDNHKCGFWPLISPLATSHWQAAQLSAFGCPILLSAVCPPLVATGEFVFGQ